MSGDAEPPAGFGFVSVDAARFGAPHPLMPKLFAWRFPAWIVSWTDGDTAVCRINRGLDDESTRRVRLLGSVEGAQAYELRDKDPQRRALAVLGKARSIELAPPGAPVILLAEARSGDIKPDGFGRLLAQMTNADGVNVGDALLAEGLAVPYAKTAGVSIPADA